MAGIFDPGIFDSGIFDTDTTVKRASEHVTQADVATRSVNPTRSTTDAVTQADSSSPHRFLTRTATDAVAQSDAAVSQHNVGRTTTDGAGATDVATVPIVEVPPHVISDPDPVYHGASMAIHVEHDPNPSVVPIGASPW